MVPNRSRPLTARTPVKEETRHVTSSLAAAAAGRAPAVRTWNTRGADSAASEPCCNRRGRKSFLFRDHQFATGTLYQHVGFGRSPVHQFLRGGAPEPAELSCPVLGFNPGNYE